MLKKTGKQNFFYKCYCSVESGVVSNKIQSDIETSKSIGKP